MFNLAGFGAMGFGFTMNLGGNREGGPQFQMGFSFLPFLIGAFVIVLTSIDDFLPSFLWESELGTRIPPNRDPLNRNRGSTIGGGRTRTNPNRVRTPLVQEQNGFFEYLFYSIYIIAIISFIGYAFFQRNRHAAGRL